VTVGYQETVEPNVAFLAAANCELSRLAKPSLKKDLWSISKAGLADLKRSL
jgi:hypothetical protein